MKRFKRIIAIMLCFGLIVLSCNSMQINTIASKKSYTKKAVSILKKHSYYVDEMNKDSISASHKKAYRNIWIYNMDTKKDTSYIFKGYIQHFKDMAKEQDYIKLKIKKSKNTARITIIEDGDYYYGLLKKNYKSKRVIYTCFEYFQKHKPKAKKVRKQYKKQMKLVNKLMKRY